MREVLMQSLIFTVKCLLFVGDYFHICSYSNKINFLDPSTQPDVSSKSGVPILGSRSIEICMRILLVSLDILLDFLSCINGIYRGLICLSCFSIFKLHIYHTILSHQAINVTCYH